MASAVPQTVCTVARARRMEEAVNQTKMPVGVKGGRGKRPWGLIGIAGAFLLYWVGVLLWGLLAPPPSYLEIGRRFTHAVHMGDPKGVLRHTNPLERQVSDLSHERVAAFMSVLVPNDFSQWRKIDERYETFLGGSVALQTIYESPQGKRATLAVMIMNTDKGPGASMVRALLGLRMEASGVQVRGLSSIGEWVKSNRKSLEEVGMTGFMSESNGKFGTWDNLIAFTEKMKRMHAASQPSP